MLSDDDLESIFVDLEEYDRNTVEDDEDGLYVKLVDRIMHHHS